MRYSFLIFISALAIIAIPFFSLAQEEESLKNARLAVLSFEEWKENRNQEIENGTYSLSGFEEWKQNGKSEEEIWEETKREVYGEIEEGENNNHIDEGQLYRNEEHGFRIKFPDRWTLEDGDGEHVIKKAVKDGSTVMILVNADFLNELLTEEERALLSDEDIQSLEMNDFTDEEVKILLESFIEAQLEAFPGSTVLEKEVRYLDNRKAIYFKMNQVYRVQDIQVEGISENYFTIHRGKLYQVGGSYSTVPVDESTYAPEINVSLSTFVFEDWSNNSESSKDASKNSIWGGDTNTTSIILLWSFLFTWILGLLPSILIRFVFLKRPIQKWIAIIIASFIFIEQIFISLILSNGQTDSIAGPVILVTLASYWILTRESVRYRYCPYCKKVIKREALFCKKCGKEV